MIILTEEERQTILRLLDAEVMKKRVVLEVMHKHEWLHGYIENKHGLAERIIAALEEAAKFKHPTSVYVELRRKIEGVDKRVFVEG